MPVEKLVRTVRWDDVEAIRRIYRPYIEKSAVSFEERLPRVEKFRERVDRIAGKYPWLVYEGDGEILGYAYGCRHRERAAYRWSVEVSVYVDERFHRQGIGRVLYERLLTELKARGFRNAYAGITLPNDTSEAFHREFGFEKVGVYEKVGYKMGRWRDVAWYGLVLNEHDEDPEPPRSDV